MVSLFLKFGSQCADDIACNMQSKKNVFLKAFKNSFLVKFGTQTICKLIYGNAGGGSWRHEADWEFSQ